MLPATQVGGHLIIETRLDRRGVARFLIDTGSSVTLLSPEFATRVGSGPSAYDGPQVRVRGADATRVNVTINEVIMPQISG